MIWGETNRTTIFSPLPENSPVGPRAYAVLLDAAYRAIKREDRRDIVVGGMTFSFGTVYPAKWIRWMRLPSGRPPRLDEYGHNPFSSRVPDLSDPTTTGYPDSRDINDLDLFAREVRRNWRGYGRSPRLWLSEYTVSSNRPNRAFAFYKARPIQARWLTRAFAVAGRVGAAGLGWFNLQDEPLSVSGRLTTGLITYEGKRKPSYWAYRRVPPGD